MAFMVRKRLSMAFMVHNRLSMAFKVLSADIGLGYDLDVF